MKKTILKSHENIIDFAIKRTGAMLIINIINNNIVVAIIIAWT
jgi:hypothetical protein